MSRQIPPPPTRFGAAPPTAQAKPAGMPGSPRTAPPPAPLNRLPSPAAGGGAPVQAKAGPAAPARPGAIPGPAPIRTLPNPVAGAAQAKPAFPAVPAIRIPAVPAPHYRVGTVQKMEDETVTTTRTKRKVTKNTYYNFGGYYHQDDFDEAFEDQEDIAEHTFTESGAIEDESDDYVYEEEDYNPADWRLPGDNETWPYRRPGWKKGTYNTLFTRQVVYVPSVNGLTAVLNCGLCKKPIELNDNGKEVWWSSSSNKHETRPPIDHDKPDWIVRLNELKNLVSLTGIKDNKTIRKMVVDAYHKEKLHLTHMRCNSAKPKQGI